MASASDSLTNNFHAQIAGFTDNTGNPSLYEGILVSHATSVNLTDDTHLDVVDGSTDLGIITFASSMTGER
jgi:hypothetical protein